jgi:hypothetical protein
LTVAVQRIRRVPGPIGVTIVRQSDTGHVVPASIPAEDLTPEDMARVTPDDWADIGKVARGYCRTVDATRSRKRMDGSATIVKSGYAPYGTDDVSDDVTQDAVFMFAAKLRDILKSCAVSALWVDTREPYAWAYVRKDMSEITVTRRTLQFWAVRDAAARNGYRIDVKPDETDATPGAQVMRAVPHAEHVTPMTLPSEVSITNQAVWRTAWGDGRDYPTLKAALFLGSEAEHLRHAGILATIAQATYGGIRGSDRQVKRTRRNGQREWAELSENLNDARETFAHSPLRALEVAAEL